jgi:predicted TIM-barrel fold metal-dependent hydrolase
MSLSTPTAQELLEELKRQPAIDHHCHPLRRWPVKLTAVELRSAFTEALDQRLAERHVEHAAVYKDAIRRLAAVLVCEPTEPAVLGRRASADAVTLGRKLLDATNTEMMLVDRGFLPADAFTPAEQQKATGIAQREILRLETIAEGLLASAGDPAEWLAATRSALREGIRRGAVAVKTICAYRASLRLRAIDQEAQGIAFNALKQRVERGQSVRLSGDSLCHPLVFEAALECRSLEVPLQVHCGFGDPDEDLAESSPLGLRPLLVDPAYDGLKIALLHCYPYHREAAYLCSVFPAVYMDLSLTIPFAALDGVRAMKETLGLCPTTKLLYASDASRYPEVFYVAASAHREALAEALAELVDRSMLSRADAIAAGGQILNENARDLYRLATLS